jgi:hypothetical protein
MEKLEPEWGHYSIERDGNFAPQFVVCAKEASLSDILDALEAAANPRLRLVVVPVNAQEGLVVRGDELFSRLHQTGVEFDQSLSQLMPEHNRVPLVQRGGQSAQSIRSLLRRQPTNRLIYIQDDRILGVLTNQPLSGFTEPLTPTSCWKCSHDPPHVFEFGCGVSFRRDTNGSRCCPHDGSRLRLIPTCEKEGT